MGSSAGLCSPCSLVPQFISPLLPCVASWAPSALTDGQDGISDPEEELGMNSCQR